MVENRAVNLLRDEARNAEYIQNIAVVSCDFVDFEGKAIFFTNFLKRSMSVATVTLMSNMVAVVGVWLLEVYKVVGIVLRLLELSCSCSCQKCDLR